MRIGARTDPGLRMPPQEKRIAYSLAGAGVAAFATIWTPWNGGTHLVGFLLGATFAGSLALLALQGHRLWTAFGAFLNGVFAPWGFAYIFGAAYIAFAGWLAWRAHRAVKASINADPLGGATPLPARTTRRPSRSAPSKKKKDLAIESGRVTPKGTAKRRSPKRTSRTR